MAAGRYEHALAQVRVWDFAAAKGGSPRIVDMWVPDYPFVTAVTVSRMAEELPAISLTIDAPFEEGRELHDSTLFALGNIVGVRFGWTDTGQYTNWFYGQLDKGGVGLELTPDGVTGTVQANTAAVHIGYRPVDNSVRRTALEVVKASIDRIGLVADISVAAATKLGVPNRLVLGPRGHLEIIRQMASDFNLTYWIATNGFGEQTMFIRSKAEVHAAPPNRVFRMRGRFDPEAREMPMISFVPESSNSSWMYGIEPPGARSMHMLFLSDDDESIVNVEVTDENDDSPAGDILSANPPPSDVVVSVSSSDSSAASAQMVLDRATSVTTEIANSMVVPSASGESGAVAAGQYYRGVMSDGIPVVITTFGIPDIEVQETISVFPDSRRYTGVYVIKALEDRLTADGWECSITAFKNGVNATAIADSLPAGGQNVAEPE